VIAVTPLPEKGTAAFRELVDRAPTSSKVDAEAQAVLEQVRQGGDTAVRALTQRFDGVDVEPSRVDPSEVARALKEAAPALLQALERAAANIEAAHRAQGFSEERVEVVPGVQVGREWRALDRVGIYVPGGRAAYPSSVLMMGVPARVAGCAEVVLCSPPDRRGRIAESVLVAAGVAGVTELHAIGGAQAIAAMGIGTESVRRVDKIFGPGNAHVTSAKRQLFGEVAIDMPAGPSEVVVLSDGTAPASWLTADLRAQAEHAPDALAVLVTTDGRSAEATARELGDQEAGQVHIFTADHLESAIEFANRFAPEHLILAVKDPNRWLPQIRHAGSVFLGAWSPAAAGDYATGANHVLPTGGSASRFGPLDLGAFGHSIQIQAISPGGIARLAEVVEPIAKAEGFTRHWESVQVRVADASPCRREAPLARLGVRDLVPYQWELSTPEVARRAGIEVSEVIRFDTNSCPWDATSLAELGPVALGEYPDCTYAELTEALAEYAQVPVAGITVGAGADEVLDLLARTFVGVGDPVLLSDPTYSWHRVVSQLAGGRILAVPATDWQADRNQLLRQSEHARLTWLCNPNNPTGEILPLEFIGQLATASPGVVVVDEAYYEFAGVTAVGLVAQLPNLVVVRTLSKAFGLAGLRVGYAISDPAVAAAVGRVRPPGSISSLAAAIATRAVEAPAAMLAGVARLGGLRSVLAEELEKLGLEVRRTTANFLLVATPPALPGWLSDRGLVVRTYGDQGSMAGWSRVTVRSERENARLVEAITEWRRDGEL
jgi:histidinol dehydrogenase